MSRDTWFNATGGYRISSASDEQTILDAFRHNQVSTKTSDPEAADYDEAAELFFQGVKLARIGDLEAGCAQIATAFLLDGRSINFSVFVPQNPAIRALCVDLELLCHLSQAQTNNLHSVSYGGHVLRILVAGKLGNDPTEGQNFLASAMTSVNYLLQRVREQPHLGAHYSHGGVVLGGCMTYANLLYQRCVIYMAMGNYKKASGDLTKALECDPKHSAARSARAALWANLQLKDDKTAFYEFKRLTSEVHPDDRGLEVAYAWMAVYVLRDAKLGSLADAKVYYEKCLRASMRKAEIYGPTKRDKEPPVLQMVKDQYAEVVRNPEVRQFREQLDVAVETGRPEDPPIPEGFQSVPKELMKVVLPDTGSTCLKCGKMADAGKRLWTCTQCRKVHYCSVECQRADWKKHKGFCKAAKVKRKDFASKEGTDPTEKVAKSPTSSVAKEPIDTLNSGFLQCQRMLRELELRWDKYGEGFAAWWNELKSKQQVAILMELTAETLPRSYKCTSTDDIQTARGLIQGGRMSGCCIGLDLDFFMVPCGCLDLHFFNQKVLHLIHSWTKETQEAEQAELQFCKTMVDTHLFPLVGPDDVSTVTYAVTRKARILGLLIKLFDEYQKKVRRQLTLQPWERLHGCHFCHQGCESDLEAKKCHTCTVTWWCCKGCKKASAHGKNCPHEEPMHSAVIFEF